MPDLHIEAPLSPAGPPPPVHPMDPARGENLSPKFAALLCFLIGRPAMTEPAITGVAVTGECVFAATDRDPFFNALIGSWSDVEANLRNWGAACDADHALIDGLVDTVRRASQ